MEDRAFLSTRAAAKEYGIPYWLLLEGVRTGRIKTVTLSKRRLIPAEGLRAFLAEANRPHVVGQQAMDSAETAVSA